MGRRKSQRIRQTQNPKHQKMTEEKQPERLVNCLKHGKTPYSFICKHLLKTPTQIWIPIELAKDDNREVDHDYLCQKCDAEDLHSDDEKCVEFLKILCIHCVRRNKAVQNINHDTRIITADPTATLQEIAFAIQIIWNGPSMLTTPKPMSAHKIPAEESRTQNELLAIQLTNDWTLVQNNKTIHIAHEDTITGNRVKSLQKLQKGPQLDLQIAGILKLSKDGPFRVVRNSKNSIFLQNPASEMVPFIPSSDIDLAKWCAERYSKQHPFNRMDFKNCKTPIQYCTQIINIHNTNVSDTKDPK